MLNDDSPKGTGSTNTLAIPRIELPKFTLRGDAESLFSRTGQPREPLTPTRTPLPVSRPAQATKPAATTASPVAPATAVVIQTTNPYLANTSAAPVRHPVPRVHPNNQQPMPRPKRSRAVTPGKLGVLSVIAAFAMIVAQGNPAALRTNAGTASSLPGAPAASAPVGQASASPQNPAQGNKAAGKTAAGKTKKSSVLPMTRGPAGLMSPSAAASVSVERGGKAPKALTDKVRMQGIPSPAAAATMASKTLPMTVDDGATMPATSERDSHAVDTHYGSSGTQTLGMEPMVERPVMTPGEAARRAELGVVEQSLQETTGSYALPANASDAAF